MSLTEAGRIPGEAFDQALARSAAVASRGFFFDFDGVLAPISPDPDAVTPVPGAVTALVKLAPFASKLAVISARPVSFLARQFGQLPGLALVGMYGLETSVGGEVRTDPAAQEWIPAVDAARRAAVADLGPLVHVEDKRIAVALHYRQHPERKDAVHRWASAKAAELGLTEQSGRMVVELKPPVLIDKGTVLGGQISDLACAWYFGDDISDAKAFAAIRARQREDPEFVGICVAVRNSETGQSLQAQADLVLPAPAAMPAALARAAAALAAAA